MGWLSTGTYPWLLGQGLLLILKAYASILKGAWWALELVPEQGYLLLFGTAALVGLIVAAGQPGFKVFLVMPIQACYVAVLFAVLLFLFAVAVPLYGLTVVVFIVLSKLARPLYGLTVFVWLVHTANAVRAFCFWDSEYLSVGPLGYLAYTAVVFVPPLCEHIGMATVAVWVLELASDPIAAVSAIPASIKGHPLPVAPPGRDGFPRPRGLRSAQAESLTADLRELADGGELGGPTTGGPAAVTP